MCNGRSDLLGSWYHGKGNVNFEAEVTSRHVLRVLLSEPIMRARSQPTAPLLRPVKSAYNTIELHPWVLAVFFV